MRDSEIRQAVGARIRRARAVWELTQEELALRLKVSAEAVSHWETGRRNPGLMALVMLCQVLRVSADELLFGDESPTDEAVIPLRLPPAAVQYLATLLATGLYGHDLSAVCERLVCAELHDMIASGALATSGDSSRATPRSSRRKG